GRHQPVPHRLRLVRGRAADCRAGVAGTRLAAPGNAGHAADLAATRIALAAPREAGAVHALAGALARVARLGTAEPRWRTAAGEGAGGFDSRAHLEPALRPDRRPAVAALRLGHAQAAIPKCHP